MDETQKPYAEQKTLDLQKMHTVCFHLYKILKPAKCISINKRLVAAYFHRVGKWIAMIHQGTFWRNENVLYFESNFISWPSFGTKVDFTQPWYCGFGFRPPQ